MDEADRIPIDVDYEMAASVQESDSRMTLRENGTVLINILSTAPCEPAPSTGSQIIVCGRAPNRDSREIMLPNVTPTEALGDALSTKIGPLELGSIDRGDGTRVFGARIRF